MFKGIKEVEEFEGSEDGARLFEGGEMDLTQRRKVAKKKSVVLCGFAPWGENHLRELAGDCDEPGIVCRIWVKLYTNV